MKKYLFIIAGFVLLFSSSVVAQPKLDTFVVNKSPQVSQNDRNYPLPKTTKKGRDYKLYHDMQDDDTDSWMLSDAPPQDRAIKRVAKFNVWAKVKVTGSGGSIFYRIKKSEFAMDYEKGATHVHLHDIKEIELATNSITPQNANKYKYRIITLDGEELVPWTTPSDFRSNKFTTYAYLGKFNGENTTLILTIVERGNKNKESIYVYHDHTKTAAEIDRISVKSVTGTMDIDPPNWTRGFQILSINYPLNIQLRIENAPYIERYQVYLKRKYHGEHFIIPVGNNWKKSNGNKPTIFIDRSFFNKPGVYTIIIQYELKVSDHLSPVPIGDATKVNFWVVPLTDIVPLSAIIILVSLILAIAAFVFVIYRASQKRKLARKEKDKLIATLQLQSVRSQLNPHFIFNALAGVQNLMNKNEVENANKYLARFARLTRNVLDEGQKELTSIQHEVSLLTDYLEMEQMRFGFKFTIDVDAAVDQQIEIPAMLLQPFVENAVKHGISALKSEGLIAVNINQAENDIVLKVADNGGGFTNNPTPGMGIKLCEERIKLLNSIYKNSTILLHISSTQIGTIITIELKNWL